MFLAQSSAEPPYASSVAKHLMLSIAAVEGTTFAMSSPEWLETEWLKAEYRLISCVLLLGEMYNSTIESLPWIRKPCNWSYKNSVWEGCRGQCHRRNIRNCLEGVKELRNYCRWNCWKRLSKGSWWEIDVSVLVVGAIMGERGLASWLGCNVLFNTAQSTWIRVYWFQVKMLYFCMSYFIWLDLYVQSCVYWLCTKVLHIEWCSFGHC